MFSRDLERESRKFRRDKESIVLLQVAGLRSQLPSRLQLNRHHWRDHVDVKHRHADQSGDIEDSLGSWISADLLKRYEVLEKHDSEASPSVSVTRQACVALLGDSPRLPSDQVACTEYAASWEGNEAYAPFIRELLEKQEFEAAYAKIAEASPFSARETSRGVPAM
jgi:hypothetical protein